MIGIVPTYQAKSLAQEAGLDLVEISPNAEPPVCRIMDFGKFRYEERRKEKLARKHHHAAMMKEIKFHSNVGEHDYKTKVRHIREFVQKGHRVKVSLYFRGRENVHRELGFEVIKRALKDCDDLCNVEAAPKLLGNSIISVLCPKSGRSQKPAGTLAPASPALPLQAPAPTAPPALLDPTATT